MAESPTLSASSRQERSRGGCSHVEAREEPVWGQRQQPDMRSGHGAGRMHNGSPALLTFRTLLHVRPHVHTHTHVTGHLTQGSLSWGRLRHRDLPSVMVTLMEVVLHVTELGEPVPWIRSQTCLACIPALPRGCGVTLHPLP